MMRDNVGVPVCYARHKTHETQEDPNHMFPMCWEHASELALPIYGPDHYLILQSVFLCGRNESELLLVPRAEDALKPNNAVIVVMLAVSDQRDMDEVVLQEVPL